MVDIVDENILCPYHLEDEYENKVILSPTMGLFGTKKHSIGKTTIWLIK